MKKRLFPFAVAIMLAIAALAGCGAPAHDAETTPATVDEKAAQPVAVNAVALKGPTAMGLVKFMSDAESGAIGDAFDYRFSIAATPDEVVPKIAQGDVDIAAIPANLASVLYNNTGEVQVLGINTLGVLYLCDQDGSVQNVSDLAGKTIYASGKGSTPEYALNYILEGNGLTPGEDVTVEWKSEHAECVAAMTENPQAIALLPQPFVTVAQSKNSAIRVALDLTEEWDALQDNAAEPSTLVTGVVVARADFVKEHPDAVTAFMQHYEESVRFVNDNTDEAAELVGSYDIVSADVAAKALPACNIVWIEGADMKRMLSGYLGVLADQNPKSIGGVLPGDDFYYDASRDAAAATDAAATSGDIAADAA